MGAKIMKNGYLKDAKHILGLAKGGYMQAKGAKNEMKARQAAEKGYLCLTKAIKALFVAKGAKGALPNGERGRLHFLLKYADKETRGKYHEIRHALHIDAFGEGIIIYEDLDAVFDDLEGLVKKVESGNSH